MDDLSQFQSLQLIIGNNKLLSTVEQEAIRQQMRDLSRRKRVIHIIVMADRPGAKEFLHLLEFTYFPPNTKRNTEFELRIVEWASLNWFFITLPQKCLKFAQRSADRTGMVLRDRIPLVLANTGEHPFPFTADNIYLIENQPGSPIYRDHDPIALQQQEQARIARIIDPKRN